MRNILSVVLFSAALLPGRVWAQELTLEGAPPVVVKTVPEAGSSQVDPSLAEIRITFSKDMRDRSWSWVIARKENYPETTGEPAYAHDKRTCVLPVKLRPGKTYAVWINSQRHLNFKDADGQSAVPYFLVFRTKG